MGKALNEVFCGAEEDELEHSLRSCYMKGDDASVPSGQVGALSDQQRPQRNHLLSCAQNVFDDIQLRDPCSCAGPLLTDAYNGYRQPEMGKLYQAIYAYDKFWCMLCRQ